MNKNDFLEQVAILRDYSNKLLILYEMDVISNEGILSDMENTIGTILIISVNSHMESPHEDYFFETFWNNINNEDFDWADFYAKLVVGIAPSDYVERYS